MSDNPIPGYAILFIAKGPLQAYCNVQCAPYCAAGCVLCAHPISCHAFDGDPRQNVLITINSDQRIQTVEHMRPSKKLSFHAVFKIFIK